MLCVLVLERVGGISSSATAVWSFGDLQGERYDRERLTKEVFETGVITALDFEFEVIEEDPSDPAVFLPHGDVKIFIAPGFEAWIEAGIVPIA